MHNIKFKIGERILCKCILHQNFEYFMLNKYYTIYSIEVSTIGNSYYHMTL